MTPQVPPGAPVAPSAVAGPGQATVTVSPPTTGGAPASYLVTATGGPKLKGSGTHTCTVTGASGSCTVSGLTNGDTYTFSSTATNAGGTSASSGPSAPVTPQVAPPVSPPRYAVPTVSAVSPGTGPAVGGSLEVITGTNFTAVSAVTFGITAATDVTDVNSTSITVVDPAGTGTVDVTVGSLHGTSPVSLADQFAYVTSPAIGLPPPSPAPGPGATLVPPPVRTGGSVAASPQGPAYWALGPAGQLSDHGGAANYGSENGVHLNSPINALNSTATGHGYWLVAADGGVFSFGDAKFYGSLVGKHLNPPIVAIARTADDKGYWLVAADGGVFSFGDAKFYGSLVGKHLNQPVTGIVAAPDGHGYWLVAADGGVFSFGSASFNGSLGAVDLDRRVVGIGATPDGHGYWLVAAGGGVFSFGDAHFYGSLGATGSVAVMGIITNADAGYRLITRQGVAYAFGTNP